MPPEAMVEMLLILAENLDEEERRLASQAARTERYRDRRALTDTEWLPLRRQIIERDGETCAYCGKVAGIPYVDHILPLAKGGTNDPSNLVVACGGCNSSKGSKTVAEWRAQ